MELKQILSRVDQRLDALNLSSTAASLKAGLSRDAIRNMRRSVDNKASAGVSTKTIAALAPVLETTVEWLLVGAPKSPETAFQSIEVKGAVEAGVMKEAIEWADTDRYTINVPLPEIYEMVKPFALEVRGPSMNKVFPDGSIIICATMYALGEEVMDGKRYVVQRSDNSHSYEATVKTLKFNEGGEAWLWPESTNPEYQTPVKISGKDGEEIVILARVIAFFQSM